MTGVKWVGLGTSLLLTVGLISFTVAESNESNTQKVLNEALSKSVASLEMSRMALLESTSLDMKAFAQAVVVDQVSTIEKIQALGASRNLDLVGSSSWFHDAKKTYLEMHDGESFNQLYTTMLMENQQRVVTLMQAAEYSGDVDVRAFALTSLPEVRQQLQETQLMAVLAHQKEVGDAAVAVAQE